jgi:hypothetical protein
MAYDLELQSNNIELQEILDSINNLPEAGSGGVDLPELTNEGEAANLLAGEQLIDSTGNIVTGTMPNNGSMTKTMDGINTKSVSVPAGYTSGGTVSLTDDIDNEVDTQADLIAQISSVLDGKVGGGSDPVLQSKTVTPTTSKQTVKPDTGYDGLSDVTVNAMASGAMSDITVSSAGVITSQIGTSGYLASGTKKTKSLTTQAAKTVTPTTSNQTAVASGRYTTGAVTVKGDSNLIAGNIKKGTSIFGVTGTYEGSGGGSGGGVETFTIEVANDSFLVEPEVCTSVYRDGAYMRVLSVCGSMGGRLTIENCIQGSAIILFSYGAIEGANLSIPSGLDTFFYNGDLYIYPNGQKYPDVLTITINDE